MATLFGVCDHDFQQAWQPAATQRRIGTVSHRGGTIVRAVHLADYPRKQGVGMAISAFLAYPSQPADLAETLRTAADRITKGRLAEVTPWVDIGRPGHIIIETILEAIDSHDVFMCDLTHMNPNVLFELGYALATRRHIWPMRNGALVAAGDDFDRLGLFATLQYTEYENSHQIEDAFYKNMPAPHGRPLGDELFSDYLGYGVGTDLMLSLIHI